MPKYFEMEVSLLGIEPRIWRRFLIRADASFQDLHDAIQEACGWQNAHLFEFMSGKGVEVSPPQFTMQKGLERIVKSEYAETFDEEDDVPVAGDIKLQQYFSEQSEKCFYVYDFGDYWEHLVELKGIVEQPERFTCQLLDGARAFPPEDCGGTFGYEECCEALTITPKALDELDAEDREELESRKELIGDWDPDSFDLSGTKKRFDC